MKKAKLVLALALVITLIGAFIASGVQTVGRTVNISNITLTAEDGRTISALLFVPDSATGSTPAPAVLLNHGYLNTVGITETAIAVQREIVTCVCCCFIWCLPGEPIFDAIFFLTVPFRSLSYCLTLVVQFIPSTLF